MNEICPSCGSENIAGEDGCIQCMHSLMQVDLPKPKKEDNLQSTIMTSPISDLLTGKDLLVASRKDPLQKIAKILGERKKDCILVYENKKLVGILSIRDLLKKASENHVDLSKTTVEEIMTPDPESVKPEDPVAVVVNKMSMGGFRHVPVLTATGVPLSIISIKDVLGYLSKEKKVSPAP